MEEEKLIRAALRTIRGVGSQHLRQLIAYFGSALKAWEAPNGKYRQLAGQGTWLEEVLSRREEIDPWKVGEGLRKQGIQLIAPAEPEYPALLAELADAPPLLYYRGQLRGQTEVLAVVGARQATAYGKSAARTLAGEAAKKGIVVVSGLARGIDAAAHRGALESGGVTWAFQGCGLDYVYPAENKSLAEEILVKGALISEFVPGTPPRAENFPVRNRLISGCARGILVAEAAEKSGALITVDFALEQGREVYAVPGPIFSKMSRGTHHLLRQGAKIAEGIEDILQEWPGSGSAWRQERHSRTGRQERLWGENQDATEISTRKFNSEKISEKTAEDISAGIDEINGRAILEHLSDNPVHIDQLIVHSPLSVSNISLALLELQLAGKILQLPGQYYVLAR